jgi:hypothetical protein
MEPVEEHMLCGAFQVRNVNVDLATLSYPVESPNALFKQIGVRRQIKTNQMLGELKIPALTTDFRAYQCLRAANFFCEVGGSSIPLYEAQGFVEGRAAYPGFEVQMMFQR